MIMMRLCINNDDDDDDDDDDDGDDGTAEVLVMVGLFADDNHIPIRVPQ
jgi:hypothetical protein